MKVLKWTPNFKIDEEPSIVPVWIALPHLPLYLCTENFLKGIGNVIGSFLKVDLASISLIRPSVAQICVEVDLLGSLPDRVRIGDGDFELGYWQDIEYEFLPEYCCKCRKIGHSEENCKPGAMIQRFPNIRGGMRKQWERKKGTENNSGMEGNVKDAEASEQDKNQAMKGKNVLISENAMIIPSGSGKDSEASDKRSESQPAKKAASETQTDKIEASEERENSNIDKTEIQGSQEEKQQEVEKDNQQGTDPGAPNLPMVVFSPQASDELRPPEFLAGKEFAMEFHGNKQEDDNYTTDLKDTPTKMQDLTEDGFIQVQKKGKNKDKSKSTQTPRVTRAQALLIKPD